MPIDKHCWMAHTCTGAFIIMFIYKGGYLAMGMSEIEYDVYDNMKIIAVEEDVTKREAPLDFEEILKLLDWRCKDYPE